MQELWVVCVLALWLTVNFYFLYCLEKRKPWAKDIARTIALYEGFSPGNPLDRSITTHPSTERVEETAQRPSDGRLDISTS